VIGTLLGATLALVLARAWLSSPTGAEVTRSREPVPVPRALAETNYSPFVVDIDASHDAIPFHLISFKDVGLSLPDDAARQVAYESLAESLSLELGDLSSDLGAPMSGSVRHDQRLTLPSAHLACDGGHVYVDVWRSAPGGPYGYSLWSGCGEDDRFAYNESVVASSEEATHSMDPLAHEIAASLEDALRRRCFQRSC
jgi:hypothetical protein